MGEGGTQECEKKANAQAKTPELWQSVCREGSGVDLCESFCLSVQVRWLADTRVL